MARAPNPTPTFRFHWQVQLQACETKLLSCGFPAWMRACNLSGLYTWCAKNKTAWCIWQVSLPPNTIQASLWGCVAKALQLCLRGACKWLESAKSTSPSLASSPARTVTALLEATTLRLLEHQSIGFLLTFLAFNIYISKGRNVHTKVGLLYFSDGSWKIAQTVTSHWHTIWGSLDSLLSITFSEQSTIVIVKASCSTFGKLSPLKQYLFPQGH